MKSGPAKGAYWRSEPEPEAVIPVTTDFTEPTIARFQPKGNRITAEDYARKRVPSAV
jgi:hypothetical protein